MRREMPRGNLFEFPENLPEGEFFENLLKAPGVRLERILSRGDVTPPGEWYDQEEDEWVVLLRGEAVIEYADGGKIRLFRGDWVFIPAHVPHRVAWTSVDPPCVWLALKYIDTQG